MISESVGRQTRLKVLPKEYEAHCRAKGLKESSIQLYVKLSRRFLAGLESSGSETVAEINAERVMQACLLLKSTYYWETIHDLMLDFMQALYAAHGDSLTYLYVGSTRDGCLAKYQSYLNGQDLYVDDRQGLMYSADLRNMIYRLQEAIPEAGIYLFDFLPYSVRPNQLRLTQHTILITKTVYWHLTDRVSVIDWLADAVQGNVQSHGLQLLRRPDGIEEM